MKGRSAFIATILLLGGCGGNQAVDEARDNSTTSGVTSETTTTLGLAPSTSTSLPTVTLIPPLTTVPYSEIPCDTNYPSTVIAPTGAFGMRERYTCYAVTGNTVEEIQKNIRSNPSHPLDNKGVAFTATTSAQVEFTWITAAVGDGCRAKQITAYLWVEETYPRWVASPSGPQSPPQEWTADFVAVRMHEDGHKQIAIDTTKDAFARISALRVPDCADFDGAARAVVDEAKAIRTQKNEEYDVATNHGPSST